MSRQTTIVGALTLAALVSLWAIVAIAPRWYGRAAPAMATREAIAPSGPERKIKATLYYVSEDGLSIVPVEREVPFGEPIVDQARRIIESQLGSAPPAPLVSPIPAGTALRSLFISDRGDAFVDLSVEVTTKHPGGALNELFTVYAFVNALTVNLPSITRVQLLVNGKEVDTLAGHVDLRRPLQKNLTWVASQAAPAADNK
jgi:hypothetical protein